MYVKIHEGVGTTCYRIEFEMDIIKGFELDIIEEEKIREKHLCRIGHLQRRPKDTSIVKVNSWNFEKLRRESG